MLIALVSVLGSRGDEILRLNLSQVVAVKVRDGEIPEYIV